MNPCMFAGLLTLLAPPAPRDIYLEPRPEDMPALVAALQDRNLQTGAASALAKIGKPAVPPLQRALADQDAAVRLWAAFALGGIGADAADAVPDLVRLTADKDDSLRAVAVESLGKIGPPAAAAAPVLIESLKDSQPRVRCWSAAALGKVRPESRAAVLALIAALKDEPARNAARESLVQIGRPALSSLIDALADDDVRPEVVLALRRIDVQAAAKAGVDRPTVKDIPALVRTVQNKERSADARRRAAEWLGELGADAVPAVPALIAVLGDAAVSDSATQVLARIGKPAAPELVAALKAPDARAREASVCTLGKIGPAVRDKLSALIATLQDSDPHVRRAAALALEAIGPDAKESVPALIKTVMNDGFEPARLAAIKAMLKAPPEAKETVVAALIEAAKQPSYGVKISAEAALKKLAAAAKAGER